MVHIEPQSYVQKDFNERMFMELWQCTTSFCAPPVSESVIIARSEPSVTTRNSCRQALRLFLGDDAEVIL